MAETALGLDLASAIREARHTAGYHQVHVARAAGITPSYLSRIESGAWNDGGPWPSDQVLRSLARTLKMSSTDLIARRNRARREAVEANALGGARRRANVGNPRAYSVRIGPAAVYAVAAELLGRSPQRGTIRSVSAAHLGPSATDLDGGRTAFVKALAERLASDRGATLYRVSAVSQATFALARAEAKQLAGGRDGADVHNVHTRFWPGDALPVDYLITEHEALVAVPERRDRPSTQACLVVDDPDYVRALQDWYDDFAWQPRSLEVDYGRLRQSLDEVERLLAPAPARGTGRRPVRRPG